MGGRKPVISLTAATGLVEAIEAAGGDAGRVLRPLGLDRTRLVDPHGFMPSADFGRLLDEAADVTRDDCFGLHFGARFDPRNVGPLTYVILHSPTVGVALANAGRYLRVHNTGATVAYEREPPLAYMRHSFVGVPAEFRRQHAEYSLALGLRTVRLLAGSAWAPLEVQFEHKAPPDTAAHAEVFGAPVTFGCPTNAFVIDLDFAERAIPAADARLYPVLTKYLDDQLQAMPPEDAFLASVRRTVSDALRHGAPELDSEASAFNRAFRRWTGSTPLQHRRGKLRPP